ncbi:hypothetical protein [Mycolicibacterium llatzerense]|uniref:hypothetical protein n=1 Tax=Mycolicibacterium llatzerense TaxID=280871 RepID=UPI0021B5E8E6|nr:hypothetical protein [Mycolicibacterium llatzerense]MCT7361221.1 hypothetical protein [Mycolicibacterium llatzerense]
MQNTDFIEIKGPASLAELVAVVDPAAPATADDYIVLRVSPTVSVTLQYDSVDTDTWPYMITVESSSDDVTPVRDQTMRLLAKLRQRNWTLQATSDADDFRRLITPFSATA